jgi:hypothetical protein
MSDFEDQFATALLAKMAGSNLMAIDQQTIQPSSLGPAARIDPSSFLTGLNQQKEEQRRRETQRLNLIAEQMHPMPPPVTQIPLVEPLPPPLPPPPLPDVSSVSASPDLIKVLKSINSTLKEFVVCYRKTHNII